jgi:hypothetical protein
MAFTGKAVYDAFGSQTVFGNIAEDVSDLVSMISPTETPLLDRLGDPFQPASNVLHQWEEEDLAPSTLVTSASVNNTTGDVYIPVHVGGIGAGKWIMPGSVLRDRTSGEYLQVTACTANTITVTRAFGGTTVATIVAGSGLTVIAPAALEGADVAVDISRPRSRLTNYVQIFKKDVIISDTARSVTYHGREDEYERQKRNRVKEVLIELEKACILGKLSGNTIGSVSAYRTLKGLWDTVVTNSSSIGPTITTSLLDNAIVAAWGYGANDLDLIVADSNYQRIIDGWNSQRIQVQNADDRYMNKVTWYESTFGRLPVLVNRWMPTNSLLVLATNRIKVVPLQGQSFHFEEVSRTGAATKGMVYGEYTLEVRNEAGLAKVYG